MTADELIEQMQRAVITVQAETIKLQATVIALEGRVALLERGLVFDGTPNSGPFTRSFPNGEAPKNPDGSIASGYGVAP